MVFVYSDEDDDAETARQPAQTTAAHSSGVSAGGRVAEVACDAEAIAVSADALEELRAQAAEMHVTALRHRTSNGNGHHASGDGTSGDEGSDDGEDGGFVFEEDVVSGLAALGRAGLPFSTAGGMRVREVEAPRLWDGALASANGNGGNSDGAAAASAGEEADETPQLLRRGLPAATFVLESRRKRFREAHVDPAAGEAEAVRAGAPAPAAAAALLPPNAHDGSRPESASEGGEVEVEEEVELDVHPVYEADGTTVRALRTRGGYELTLDERDLLDGADEEGGEKEGEGDTAEEGAAAGADGDGAEVPSGVEATAADLPIAAEAAEEAGDWGEFDDGDDEDDEEEELDEALVVAVVEQLVRCCEADDLDPQMTLEAARFVATAKPLLAQLTEEVVTPAEFGQRMDRDLRRFQRIYKSVYRPRDSPIVIDGVITDL